MAKKFSKLIISLLVFALFMNVLGPASYAVEMGKNEENATNVNEEDLNSTPETNLEGGSSITNEENRNFDNEQFEKEYDFLVEDPVFQQLEQKVIEQEVSEAEIKPMWIPVVAAALRLLISKVGRQGMQKGWAIARPHVEKALKAPSKFTIDGPGGGGRIIQVRQKSNGSPIFRLDYYPVKTGGSFKLHYHVPPNMKDHHIIF